MTVDKDDDLMLSASTLDALKEFYSERDTHAERFARLEEDAKQQRAEQKRLDIDTFTEDWNESQFWYADETANAYAEELLDGTTADMTIAVVSTPSVFVALKNIMASRGDAAKPKLVLLEHDKRFSIFSEFVPYDFVHPVRLPPELKGAADRVICDPPFLNEDCQTKMALTVRWLSRAKPGSKPKQRSHDDASADGFRLIVSTGERMQGLVARLYRAYGLRTTDYEPVHARCLNNEFHCYANFESDRWKWVPSGPEDGW